ncbi:hypothetical protein ACI65C_006303 [Semiaphis heraclei]
MKRISVGFDECGQILFIDASANVDRYGCKVFMIYTNSCAGGLPVGTIILTSESTSVISVGLELWKSLFPLDALGGRGLVGPKIFMSYDSTAERNALHEAFPQSELLRCIFHILQAAWRYLWDYNHGVPLDYRQTLYLEIKNMVYSKDRDELETTYNNALQKPLVKQFPNDTHCSLFKVNNKVRNTQYTVDLNHGICSCSQGNTGFPCKHQVFIAYDLNIDLNICLPITEETRKKFHIIATGSSDIESGWYGPSKIENSNTDKLDIIQTNKINKTTMNSNNQLSYQYTDSSKSIELIEENQPKNLLETPAEDFENAMTNFNEVIEKMKRAFESDKEYFLPSMKSFVNSFQTNVRTHASLNSAMQTFGKYSGLNPNSKKPKLMGTKQIGVQPTARARRKTEIGGRRNLAAGRNPKWK